MLMKIRDDDITPQRVRRPNKKHSRTNPDLQFKKFLLTKQKTRPRMDYEWI